jgi:hypothetical protein
MAACERHRQHAQSTSAGRERAALKKRAQLVRVFREMLAESAEQRLASELAEASSRVASGADPYALVEALLARLTGDAAP